MNSPATMTQKIDNGRRRLYSSVHFALCIGHASHIIINRSSEIDNSYKDSEHNKTVDVSRQHVVNVLQFMFAIGCSLREIHPSRHSKKKIFFVVFILSFKVNMTNSQYSNK